MENRAFVIVEEKKIPEIVFQKAAKYEMQSNEAPSNSHDYEWYLGKSRGVMEGAAYIFDIDPMVMRDAYNKWWDENISGWGFKWKSIADKA